jgi:hypothetical protein
MPQRRTSQKAQELIQQHKGAIIEELGPHAFDLLTPQEVATELEIETKRIPEYIRWGWLDPVPGKDVGSAHQYYRWRVESVKRLKKPRQRKDKTPL